MLTFSLQIRIQASACGLMWMCRDKRKNNCYRKIRKQSFFPSLLVACLCALHVTYKPSIKYREATVICNSTRLCMHFRAVFWGREPCPMLHLLLCLVCSPMGQHWGCPASASWAGTSSTTTSSPELGNRVWQSMCGCDCCQTMGYFSSGLEYFYLRLLRACIIHTPWCIVHGCRI